MSAAYRPGASNSALYAAALFASENGAWQQAQTLLARIPGGSQTSDMRDLRQRVNYNLQLVTAENYLAQGNTIAASNTLRAMASTPPKAPADAGKLARLLAESGDLTTAVSLVRNNISSGVSGNAGDYADQIAVLNQAGLTGEAQNLISNPQLQASSTPTQLASIRNGYVINEADRLREQGNYAAAYDKLIRAMQSDPQNTDLMFAMARLYQSGKMNKEAGVVYDYLMTRDTPNQDARAGAIDVALSAGNNDRAEQLAGGLRQDNSPDRLLLLARVAEAQGHHQQAMTYLRSARGKLLGMQSTNSSETPTVGGVLAADNPFIGVSQTSARADGLRLRAVHAVAGCPVGRRAWFHAAGDPAHRSAGGHRPDADAASGGHHDGVAAGENRQLAAGGNGRAWTRRRIGHQQADGAPDAADLVILAVWRLAL